MPSQNLVFRQQAFEFHEQHRQWGQVALLQPLSTKLMAWFITLIAAVLIVFLFIGQYSRKESVAGYLTPTAGTARIFAPQQGYSKAVHVTEGLDVEEGAPLLTVETGQFAADGMDVNATMLATLVAQQDQLIKQIESEQFRTGSEHDRLTALVQGL